MIEVCRIVINGARSLTKKLKMLIKLTFIVLWQERSVHMFHELSPSLNFLFSRTRASAFELLPLKVCATSETSGNQSYATQVGDFLEVKNLLNGGEPIQ